MDAPLQVTVLLHGTDHRDDGLVHCVDTPVLTPVLTLLSLLILPDQLHVDVGVQSGGPAASSSGCDAAGCVTVGCDAVVCEDDSSSET